MAPLGGEIKIVVGEQQSEAVRVGRLGDAARPGGANAIGRALRQRRLEQAVALSDHRQRPALTALIHDQLDIIRARQEGADQIDLVVTVPAENGEGIGMAALFQLFDVARRKAGQSGRHRARHPVGLHRECDSTRGGESSMMQRSEARPRSALQPAFSGDSRRAPRAGNHRQPARLSHCNTGISEGGCRMSREQTIRDVAYAIWEAEGKPQGRDAQHWRMAEERVAASGGKDAGAKAKAPAKSGATGSAKTAAKAAAPAKGKASADRAAEAEPAKASPKSPAKAASTKAKPST